MIYKAQSTIKYNASCETLCDKPEPRPPSAQAHECGHRPDQGTGSAEAIKAKGEGGKSGAIEPWSRDVGET